MKKHILCVISVLAALFTLAGCSDKSDGSNSAALTASSVELISTDNIDREFSSDDLNFDYEEESAVLITLSDNGISVDGSGASVQNGVVTITAAGTYVVSGTISDGQILVDATNKADVRLALNSASITCSNGPAIYVKQADKVILTLVKGTDNFLTDSSSYNLSDDESNVDAAIFSKDDLTINGEGALTVTGNYSHGIVTKDDLVITGGTITVTAVKHAMCGKDSVSISDGTFNLTCVKDGIHSSNTDDEGKGYIYIRGGSFEINAQDDGMHAANALLIEGGTINIASSYEGLEGKTVTITGGTISVISSDDGINSASGSDTTDDGHTLGNDDKFNPNGSSENYINISGGEIKISASGDGIDSNGSLIISGGTIYVDGPSDGGNGAIDYEGSGFISGGTIIASGSSEMSSGFSENSSQCSIMYNVAQGQSGEISLKDSNGNVIASYTPSKQYGNIVISSPELTQGETYTLTAGSETYEITLSGIVTSNTFGGMGKGQMGGGKGGGQMGDEQGGAPDAYGRGM